MTDLKNPKHSDGAARPGHVEYWPTIQEDRVFDIHEVVSAAYRAESLSLQTEPLGQLELYELAIIQEMFRECADRFTFLRENQQ